MDALRLSREELERYSRHLALPEVDLEGQRKIKKARVLLVGAGGLGSPLGLYLAAAGVGKIGIVDFDTVELSNLQRQILYATNWVGKSKVESARKRLLELNPSIKVEIFETKLTSKNSLKILRDFDIIADGTDNFPARYLINDACALQGKPNVHGSVFRFEGQVSVFWAKKGPCYRCLYPAPPAPGVAPSCAEGGVLGVLPGVIGALQATEVLKLILGIGKPLIGQLLVLDALTMDWKKLRVRKDPDCAICGKNPLAPTLSHNGERKQGREEDIESKSASEMTVEELKKKLDRKEKILILDVRETHEYQACRIPGSKLIPLGQLPGRIGELNPFAEIVVHCKMGGRSAQAVQILKGKGFKRVSNLTGGIQAWAERMAPRMAKY